MKNKFKSSRKSVIYYHRSLKYLLVVPTWLHSITVHIISWTFSHIFLNRVTLAVNKPLVDIIFTFKLKLK